MSATGYIATVVASAALGFAGGYLFRSPEAAEPPESASARVERKAVADQSRSPVAVPAPQALPVRADEVPAEKSGSEPARAAERPMRGREGFRAEMERIRREEPERFARMTNFMARAHAARTARNQARRECLAQLDTTGMSAAERQAHEALQTLLDQQAELDEALRDESLSEDERKRLFEMRHELGRRLREAGLQERDTLLKQTAASLGLSGDAAEEVVCAIKDIYELTETRGGGPPGPPPDGPSPASPPQP